MMRWLPSLGFVVAAIWQHAQGGELHDLAAGFNLAAALILGAIAVLARRAA